MKIILIYFILFILIYKNLYASNSIYETNFFDINIISKNISDDKIRIIEKVKFSSLETILNNILSKSDLKKLKRKINLKNEINYLIKNIIIEDELILADSYSAKIKANFDYKQIINLLRVNNISYSDLNSPNLLFIVIENKNFNQIGLSKNNSFYKQFLIEKSALLNFIYPDLSTNDRFILPYEKIKMNSLKDLLKISEKYKSPFILILKINGEKINKIYDFDIYSSLENKIIQSHTFIIDQNDSYNEKIISLVDSWWKNLYNIDHSIINKKLCKIKNSNIHELYFIISKIKSISQTKSLKLLSIDFGENLYELIYYGNPTLLSLKLSNNNIFDNINSQNKCILSLDS